MSMTDPDENDPQVAADLVLFQLEKAIAGLATTPKTWLDMQRINNAADELSHFAMLLNGFWRSEDERPQPETMQ